MNREEERKAAEKAAFKVRRRDGLEAPEEIPSKLSLHLFISCRRLGMSGRGVWIRMNQHYFWDMYENPNPYPDPL